MYKGLGHLALQVSDVDRALDFYCNKLGLPLHFKLDHDDGTPWLHYLRVAHGQYIEIFKADKLENGSCPGYLHVSITVEDTETAYKTLTERGVELTKPTVGKCGAIQFWAHDPDGNAIEFMELVPDCMQMQNEKKYE